MEMNGRCVAQIITFVVDLASLRSVVQGKDFLTLKHLQVLDPILTRNASIAITCHLTYFCYFLCCYWLYRMWVVICRDGVNFVYLFSNRFLKVFTERTIKMEGEF